MGRGSLYRDGTGASSNAGTHTHESGDGYGSGTTSWNDVTNKPNNLVDWTINQNENIDSSNVTGHVTDTELTNAVDNLLTVGYDVNGLPVITPFQAALTQQFTQFRDDYITSDGGGNGYFSNSPINGTTFDAFLDHQQTFGPNDYADLTPTTGTTIISSSNNVVLWNSGKYTVQISGNYHITFGTKDIPPIYNYNGSINNNADVWELVTIDSAGNTPIAIQYITYDDLNAESTIIKYLVQGTEIALRAVFSTNGTDTHLTRNFGAGTTITPSEIRAVYMSGFLIQEAAASSSAPAPAPAAAPSARVSSTADNVCFKMSYTVPTLNGVSVQQPHIAGDTVEFNNVTFVTHTNSLPGNGTFVCPVAGKYWFFARLLGQFLTSQTGDSLFMCLNVNDTTMARAISGAVQWPLQSRLIESLLDLQVGDVVSVAFADTPWVTPNGTIQLISSADGYEDNEFHGHLVALSYNTATPLTSNTAPQITSSAIFYGDEGQLAVGTVTATDVDGHNVVFTIDSPDNKLQITSDGILTFVSPAPDYATMGSNTYFTATVIASDGLNTTNQQIQVNVNNLLQTIPVFSSASSFDAAENQLTIGTVVATLTDGNLSLSLTYTISPSNQLQIDSSTGVLSFVNGAPDYEAMNPKYFEATVTAADAATQLITASQLIRVNVTDVSESTDNSPVFAPPTTFNADEEQLAIGTVTASDADGDTVTFTLVNETTINDPVGNLQITSGGILTFITAPDYETMGAEKFYRAVVTATAGTNSTTQMIQVNVNDVADTASNNPPPTFQTNAVWNGILEGQTTIGQVVATPHVTGQGVTYGISVGTGQTGGLAISVGGGNLTFVSAPVAATQSVYTATVSAYDGFNYAYQSITVNVTTAAATAPTADYDFDFASATSWTDTATPQVLTFPDNTTATSVGLALTWSNTEGITTPAGGYLDIGDVTFGGQFSIEVYFRFNIVAGYNRVVAFYNSTGDGIGLVRQAGTNTLRFFNDGPTWHNRYITNEIVPGLGGPNFTFVHVVCVCGTGGAASVYVNGSLQTGAVDAGGVPTLPSTQNRANNVIGADAWGDTGNETVKRLRVYDSALTAMQVQALYTNGGF